jgi:Holliday junction DNA helicase RuvA
MLGSLHGTVTATLEQRTLIEVNHIGYWVYTGSWRPQGEVTAYLHHHVREEADDLYGFPTIENLRLFELLITVSGVGPKAALALLSIGSVDRLTQAIANEELDFICLAPGIGKKVAQKITLELKGKVGAIGSVQPNEIGVPTDLLSAMEGLGYKRHELLPLLQKLPKEITEVDAQIRWALGQIANR